MAEAEIFRAAGEIHFLWDCYHISFDEETPVGAVFASIEDHDRMKRERLIREKAHDRSMELARDLKDTSEIPVHRLNHSHTQEEERRLDHLHVDDNSPKYVKEQTLRPSSAEQRISQLEENYVTLHRAYDKLLAMVSLNAHRFNGARTLDGLLNTSMQEDINS